MPTPNAPHDKGEKIPKLMRPKAAKMDTIAEKQRGYCASIKFMDDQVSKILEAVGKTGKKDNTIIVFFSDHGYLVGDHGLMAKTTLYKEVLNPTLVIYDPRQQPRKVTQPVQLLDLVKTALDWGGVSAEDKQKPYGDSLIPLITGEGEFTRDFAVGECPGYYAIVMGDYKFIAPFEFNKDGQYVLFDLKNDPSEVNNIADANPELIARFQKKADAWLAQSGEVIEQVPIPSKNKTE